MNALPDTRFARTTRHQVDEPCRNCDTVYRGNFCPECGQEAATGAPTAFGFIYEFLTRNIFERGKLPRTVWHLLRYPGGLTVDFLEGRRQRFIRPVRLYLGMSILYFLILSLQSAQLLDQVSNWGDKANDKAGSATTQASASGKASASTSTNTNTSASAVQNKPGATETAKAASANQELAEVVRVKKALEQANVSPAMGQVVEQVLERERERARQAEASNGQKRQVKSKALAEIEGDNFKAFIAKWPDTGWRGEIKRRLHHFWLIPADQVNREVMRGILNQAPKAMFFLVPVFAMMLKMMFLLRNIPYGAHLLFAFHYHALLFLGLFVLLVLPLPDVAETVIWIGMVLYLPLSMRKTYGIGWWGALLRWSIMSIFYPMAIALAIMLALVLAFLF